MKRAKQILTEKPTHVAGWGVSLAAVVFACTAFPAIAAKADSARTDANIQARAQVFTETVIEADSFAKTLAETALTEKAAISPVAAALISQAADTVAQHKCLSEAVFYEARSEGRAGQKAVAEVVLNRVKSKHYPNSICGVVYQGSHRSTGCQFSFTCDGSLERTPKGKTWTRSQDIAALAMTGGILPMTQRATHYHNLNVEPAWSETLVMTKTVGTHKFYRTKWRERNVSSSALLVAPPSP